MPPYPPVPVRRAVDLDGLEDLRQAGRSHHNVLIDLMGFEDANLPRFHIGGGQEKLHRLACPHIVEIDFGADDIAQRVEIERVRGIG